MFNWNAQHDTDMLRQTSRYVTYIIILLMLHENCLKNTVLHFIVVIYGLSTKNQHLTN